MKVIKKPSKSKIYDLTQKQNDRWKPISKILTIWLDLYSSLQHFFSTFTIAQENLKRPQKNNANNLIK